MTDTIFVLTPTNNRPQTKIISGEDPKYKIKSPQLAKHFSSRPVEISSLSDIIKQFNLLYQDKSTFLVRGKLSSTADPKEHKRRLISNPDGGSYEPQALQTLVLDIDNIPISLTGGDDTEPGTFLPALTRYLPSIFHNVSFYWRLSGSQGFKKTGSISIHLHFWLNKPVEDTILHKYFTIHNNHLKTAYGIDFNFVDTCLFNPIQPHFTAGPMLLDDIVDPVLVRTGTAKGSSDTVQWSEDWAYEDPNRDTDKYWDYLAEIGDDKDSFHSPIMRTIASYVNSNPEMNRAHREGLKSILRESIEAAHKNPDRDHADILRYQSDSFIDALIEGALVKGYGTNLDVQARELAERYVYVRPADKFYDVTTEGLYSKQSINNTHKREAGGKNVDKALLMSNGLEMVETIQCLPGENYGPMEFEGNRVYNSWKGHAVSPEPGDASPFTEHLGYLTDYNRESYEHLLAFLAFSIQQPGQKIRHALVLGSNHQGTGKSYIKNLFRRLIGRRGVQEISNSDIKSDFNGWAKNTEMIFIEELMMMGRREAANNLKSLVTEDYNSINEKNEKTYMAKTSFNVIVFTNHYDAAYLEANDRRYWVWISPAKPKDHSYYENLHDWTDEHLPQIYHFLLHYPLNGFRPNQAPPSTPQKEEMAEMSITPGEAYIKERIISSAWPFRHDLVNTPDLMDADSYLKRLGLNRVGKYVQMTGANLLGRKRIFDKMMKLYSVRDHEKYAGMSAKELEQSYLKPGHPDDTQGVDY